jgi:hypothetical protein
MTNCVGTTDKQYSDNAACMAVCAKLPLGASDGETSGNTVGCRQYHAGASAPASSTNSTTHCPHAGPSGGDVCGSKCDAYCSIIQSACNNTNAAYASTGICMAACGSFSTTGAISDVSGISYYCHLYHATVAITDTTHCAHAAAAGSGPCGSRCENYCQIIQKNCNTTQFADANTCMGFCATNPDGDYKDTVGNTKDCRIYHAFAGVALSDTATHCPHAGHSGAGVCGSYCDTYCNLALNVCNGTHQLYATPAACTSACAGFATTGKPGDVSGNTVQCRIYHLGAAAALNDRATHCPHGGQNPTAACVGGTTTSTPSTSTSTPTSTTEASKTGNAFGLFVSVLMTLIVALI